MAITLWNPPAERPAYAIYDWDGNLVEEGTLLTEQEVYCDLCNADVIIRPVPVIGSYALCPECLDKVEPNWKEQIHPLVRWVWAKQIEASE